MQGRACTISKNIEKISADWRSACGNDFDNGKDQSKKPDLPRFVGKSAAVVKAAADETITPNGKTGCRKEQGDQMQEKRKLPNVTLVAMTSVNIRATIKAMLYSMRGIEFGDAVLITHRKPFCLPKSIRYSHTDKLCNIDDFNYKMVL